MLLGQALWFWDRFGGQILMIVWWSSRLMIRVNPTSRWTQTSSREAPWASLLASSMAL
jgi:hypothetical protein